MTTTIENYNGEQFETFSISENRVEKLCLSIQKLTEENNHTQAMKIACGFFGYEDLHDVLCEIETLHDKAGSLSLELQAIRRKVFERMLRNLYSDYSESVYEKIRSSY